MKNGGEAMNTITNELLIAHITAKVARIKPDSQVNENLRNEALMNKRALEIALATLTAKPAAGGYQPAIDILRDRAARELDGGFRAHHNALIYAANELENAQAFGQEVSHES